MSFAMNGSALLLQLKSLPLQDLLRYNDVDTRCSVKAVGDTAGWELGPQLRTRGSIHSDWWTGTAADLANCGLIAVYPVSGWWRESKGNDWSKEARYALVVTIRTAAVPVNVGLFTPTEVDIYTAVETKIKTAVPIQTEIESEGGDGE